MASASIEELQTRITSLESQVAEILAIMRPSVERDWRCTIGMFSEDPVMQEIFDEALRLREADRSAARTDPHYFDNDPS